MKTVGRLSGVMAFTFAISLSSPMAAQFVEKTQPLAGWQFQWENDAFAVFSGSDRFYTNGLRVSWMLHPEDNPEVVEDLARWLSDSLGRPYGAVYGAALGQNFYTPEDITDPLPQPEDRPWAGWLYGGLMVTLTDDTARRQHTLEFDYGVIGPPAGGEFVQRTVHEIIDDDTPEGWDNQLLTEPAVNLLYQWRRRLGSSKLDFTPHAGGSLGTIAVFANAGATVRLGHNITGFPLTPIPATAESPAFADWGGERPRTEFYAFAGVDGRAVAYNIFLDGNVFRSSPASIPSDEFVYDLRAGLSFRRNNWRLTYTFLRRSEEFPTPPGRDKGIHDFGSISLSFERVIDL